MSDTDGAIDSRIATTYDYVIVGAGSAGRVLAGRLSEDTDARVALLEAGGGDGQPEIRMPAAFPVLLKSSVDWDLLGEPEPGLGNRRLYLPRGKVLGGCSAINAMIYTRGNRVDYDAWAQAGCDGWSYDDVLPISSAPRTTSAAKTPTTASADRCGCPTGGPCIHSSTRCSRPPSKPGTNATPTSTGPAKRASAAFS